MKVLSNYSATNEFTPNDIHDQLQADVKSQIGPKKKLFQPSGLTSTRLSYILTKEDGQIGTLVKRRFGKIKLNYIFTVWDRGWWWWVN